MVININIIYGGGRTAVPTPTYSILWSWTRASESAGRWSHLCPRPHSAQIRLGLPTLFGLLLA